MTWILIIVAMGSKAIDHIEYPTKEQCEAAAAVVYDHRWTTDPFCIPGPDWSTVEGYVQE